MIQLSKKLFYAVEAVLYIAYNASAEPVSGKEISAKQGMPPRYLEQMLQSLVHVGVLRGVRGPHGGYLLAREKRKITLAEIGNAVLDDEHMPESTPLGNQVVAPQLAKLNRSLLEQMQQVTLAELYDNASVLSIRKTVEERHEFHI